MLNEVVNNNKFSKEQIDSLLENILKSKGLDEAVMLDTIKLLKEQGATIPSDEQILHKVVKNGYFNVAWYLVENGAKIYFELIVAALKNCQIKFAKYLIDKEPGLVFHNDRILCTAVDIGECDIVKKILDLDASKKVLNSAPLIHAIKNHQEKMFDLLMEYYKITDFNNNYIMEVAIREYQTNIVKKLIDLGVDITADLLFVAISYDCVEIVKLLLDTKAFDIDTVSEALERASDRKTVNTRIIKALLSKQHSKRAVKNSIKIIKERRKETWVPAFIEDMNLALRMLRKDKKTI